MLLLLIILIAIPVIIIIIGFNLSGPKYRGPVTDHFNGKQFINQGGYVAKGLKEVFTWMLNRKREPWTENTTPAYGTRPLEWYKDGIRITFVNHSTFLIQVDGVNILTDPIWSKRASPFTWSGPKRMSYPGIRLEDLPKIHVVLLSHNHYDHLDLMTMRTIFGAHHPKIVTSLGVKAFLDEQRISGATDLDWWDEVEINENITVQAVPAQHFSGRGMFDRDATLWCGYVLKTTKGKIYFAGDTGYNEKTFKEIGDKLGPFEVSLIPIGAYKPRWFMSPIHTSPDEAVKIHIEVKSKNSIATHFGTFPLADDGMNDPINDLITALNENNISQEKFKILQKGEAVNY
jgi:L-ascorbate metabolism protein UlaG (beta-lactamase superfamily)